MTQTYDDYVSRNWKPEIQRVVQREGCNCASCQLHRQLKSEWDKNQEQAREFERHLRENKAEQKLAFERYMKPQHAVAAHPRQSFAAQNKKGL